MSIGSLESNQCIFTDNKKAVTDLLKFAKSGYKTGIRKLLSKGVPPNCTDNNGCTPLHHAVSQNRIEIIPLLISYKADVDKKDNFGETPLHKAANQNKAEAADKLLEHFVKINEQDKRGTTPLHHAASKDYTEIMNILLKDNANHTNSISFLLEKGAKTHLKNRNMEKPHDKARYWNNEKAIVLLQKYDAI